MQTVKIQRALISVFDKSGLEDVVKCLHRHDVEIVSTGGTYDFIQHLGIPCTQVEEVTDYPSILGGRVKTLHPLVFGGILARRGLAEDERHCEIYGIAPIDLVIVDLYPFVQTVRGGGTPEQIIEKIDIGGVSLIRAAAKNHKDVVIVSAQRQYAPLVELLEAQEGSTTHEQRVNFAREAFTVTAAYDSAIHSYFAGESEMGSGSLSLTFDQGEPLRYGENPHQKGAFYGDLSARFDYLQGKQLSYNNLLDVDAAVHLVEEYSEPTCAILKHNTPCGLATRTSIAEAYRAALACDPVSAFGGIIVLNREVDAALASEIDQLFYEVLIAPAYTTEAREVLAQKSKRIILIDKLGRDDSSTLTYRTILGGLLAQERDRHVETASDLRCVTTATASPAEVDDLLFGMKAVKYCKSNAIVIARGAQILGAGYGQTSRVDALRQAIEKAKAMDFDLQGASLASDAFFPFADCVEIAHQAGITSFVQPGGSIKDQLSIDYCEAHGLAMYFTGIRHFRH